MYDQVTAPPPGCVEQRLSALGVQLQPASRLHSELDIPRAPHAPYSLQLLLDMFRDQYLALLRRMATPDYADEIRHQIDKEKVYYTANVFDVKKICFDDDTSAVLELIISHSRLTSL